MQNPDLRDPLALRNLAAPAKLNLFLHVVGRRPDGYHLLETVFTFLDWGDRIDLALRRDGRIVRSTALPGVPEDADLCVRAARLLADHACCALGVEISVDKRLPMGGGLGGGSSDAATVLLGLNRLWQLDLPRAELAQLGLALGADVPVFVMGESAFATGVGEVLQRVEVDPAWYLVLVPAVSVPTAVIFSAPELTRSTPHVKLEDFPAHFGPAASFGQNDLEAVVCGRYPPVRECLDWLRERTEARMSGSGCCVYAAFETQKLAEACQAAVPSGWTSFIAAGLQDHPLKIWL